MKYVTIAIIAIAIFESSFFTKELTHKKKMIHHKDHTTTITISIHPKPTIDMQVNISNSKALGLEKIIVTPNTDSIEIKIPAKNNPGLTVLKNSDDAHSVEFTIFPYKLGQYVNQPQATRKPYNYNSELDRPGKPASGGYRLFSGLTTSVKYPYNKLPNHIVLPNSMQILHELLGCDC